MNDDITREVAREIATFLARAHILMFEYDTEGFLVSATGSCLGTDADVEIRAGLVSPQVVQRAVAGERVVDRVEVLGRNVTVIHEPVIGEHGVQKVVATAFEVKETVGPPHLAELRAAFAS